MEGGLRVMVIDDNVDTAHNLALLIELGGHSVRVVHNGNDALVAAVDFAPDIIFVDILLPGMNGYDVAIALRKMPELNRPFLASLTGWTGDERRVRSRAAGFDEHITKPVHYSTIERLIGMARKAKPATKE